VFTGDAGVVEFPQLTIVQFSAWTEQQFEQLGSAALQRIYCEDLSAVSGNGLAYHLHSAVDQADGISCFRSLGDNSNNGFRIAGSHLHPAVDPVQSQTVALSSFSVWKGVPQGSAGGVHFAGGAFDAVLDDGIERQRIGPL